MNEKEKDKILELIENSKVLIIHLYLLKKQYRRYIELDMYQNQTHDIKNKLEILKIMQKVEDEINILEVEYRPQLLNVDNLYNIHLKKLNKKICIPKKIVENYTRNEFGTLTRLLFNDILPKSCEVCGSKEKLNIHHKVYEVPIKKEHLVRLCWSCHMKAHNRKSKVTLKKMEEKIK